MSFKDTFKDTLGRAKEKAGDLRHQHGDRSRGGIDETGGRTGSRTGGKYSEKIESGVDKAKDAWGNLRHRGGGDHSA